MRIKNLPSIESMNGSQDALVIEQTDGSEDKSRKVSPAQIKQYVLGNSIDDIYSVMGQNGAKNLIPYPYPNKSGFSDQGMTTTYDADGVFTINKVAGTATAYYRVAILNFLKPNTKYKLVFEVANATSISVFVQKPTSGDYVTINNKSSGIFEAEFETTAEEQTSNRSIGLWCSASDTETNATVKVMLVYASDIDNTYQPYAKTNKELTEVIGDLSQTGLTGDSVAEQLGDAKGRIANVNTAVTRLSGNYSTTLYTDFNDLPHGSIVQLMGSVPHSPGYTSRYYVVFTYFIAGTTTYRLQFAIENGSGDIFTRNCTNGTWGNWTKFATT